MSLPRRSLASRLALGLADSAMSSAGNLGVGIVAAHSETLTDIGIFATAMLVLILLTLACGAAHGDALVLGAAARDDAARARDIRRSTASVLGLAGAMGAAVGLIGLLTRLLTPSRFGAVAAILVVAGPAIPLLCLQDHLRWIE